MKKIIAIVFVLLMVVGAVMAQDFGRPEPGRFLTLPESYPELVPMSITITGDFMSGAPVVYINIYDKLPEGFEYIDSYSLDGMADGDLIYGYDFIYDNAILYTDSVSWYIDREMGTIALFTFYRPTREYMLFTLDSYGDVIDMRVFYRVQSRRD